jgi:hypothetical protein
MMDNIKVAFKQRIHTSTTLDDFSLDANRNNHKLKACKRFVAHRYSLLHRVGRRRVELSRLYSHVISCNVLVHNTIA